jgi:hypothetical protein
MLLKSLGFAFLLCTAAFGYCAEKIDYCRTIKFDPGIFDRKTLEKASGRLDCRDRPVPLLLRGKSGNQSERFSLSLETPSLASYINRNRMTGEYVFDKEEFEHSFRDSAVFKNRDFALYTYKPELKAEKTAGGEFFSCTIQFFDAAGRLKFTKRNFLFFKEEGISAMYLAGFVKAEDTKSLRILNAIEQLFLSMEIDW